MADRCQPIQRNLYTAEASQFRPDFKRTYGDDYIRGLSFVSTDMPQHARVSLFRDPGVPMAPKPAICQGLGDVGKYDSLHPNAHMSKDLGRTGGAIVPRGRAQRESMASAARGMVSSAPTHCVPPPWRPQHCRTQLPARPLGSSMDPSQHFKACALNAVWDVAGEDTEPG
jgi:hypothetical protein